MDNLDNTTVEILLATYNGEEYLPALLESIKSQTHTNWILRVRDDCSKDRTIEIINNFKLENPNKVDLICAAIPSGCAKNNFFKLLNLSQNDYVMCCDQDDIWLPDKIEISLQDIKNLENNNSKNIPLLVFTDLKVVDQNLNTISSSFEKMSNIDCNRNSLNNLLVHNVITGCTMIFNKALCNLAKFKTDYSKVIMHDSWLGLIASSFGKIKYLPVQTILYRQHVSNSVGAKNVRSIKYVFNKIFKSKQIKISMLNMIYQSDEFKSVYKNLLNIEQTNLLYQYSLLLKKSKLKRIHILVKNKLMKYGLSRKIAQILYI